jgi:hypothetical protein
MKHGDGDAMEMDIATATFLRNEEEADRRTDGQTEKRTNKQTNK